MERSSTESVSFGPFELFPAARALEKNGVPLILGNRALDILIVLVERAGQVVSHRELLGSAWRGLVVEPGNLRVHMSALRKALGDGEAGARYIENVTGQGYCFVAPVKRTSTANSSERSPSSSPSIAQPQPRGLPPRLTRMIGRDDAVNTITADLRADRFVTIVGPGGMGKTTVAVSVAHAMLAGFDGKVCFVDIGAITDPALLPATVASTLGLGIQSVDAIATLIAFLQSTRMLLVLDNCEHVIDAAASLAETIFSHAPEVHILATSREALRVEGEHAYWLTPLEGPPPDKRVSAEEALSFPAVKLFVERAAASDNRFELTDKNAPIVADICSRLDGIALALEFVAGRVGTYGLQGTADLLDKSLGLHWQGRRTAIPRHQTLSALLEWSYSLLPESERRVLRKLSIFVGTFTLEAAAAVASESDLDDARLGAAIDHLIAKSLVSVTSTHEGAPGYRLLETTRLYAIRKLGDSGEADATAERHARYFALLFAGEEPEPRPQERAQTHEHLGNLRAALQWCFGADGSRNSGLGVDLAAASAPVFLDFALWNECFTWSRTALSVLTDAARGTRRELALQEAFAISSMFTGATDVPAALIRGLEIARRLGETATRLRLLASLHFYSHRIADFKGSHAVSEEIDAVARTTNDVTSWAISDWLRGSSQYVLGNQAASMELFEKGFSYGDHRHGSDAQHLGIYYRSRGLNGLARVQWLCGYPDRALKTARQAIAEASETSAANQSYTYLLACHVFLWCGDLSTAQEIIEKVMAQPHWQGRLVWFHTEALALKGEVLVRQGSLDEGTELLRTALSDMKTKSPKNLMRTVTACALSEALAGAGRFDEALAVIGDALAPTPMGSETWETPELLRVKADILLERTPPDVAEAESCLERSIECARRQFAKGWELRATITLAKLRSMQGRHEEGRRQLAAIHGPFTEGFDTRDLKAASKWLAA